jgi:hypothetical protein
MTARKVDSGGGGFILHAKQELLKSGHACHCACGGAWFKVRVHVRNNKTCIRTRH